jgi:hypothetical protein
MSRKTCNLQNTRLTIQYWIGRGRRDMPAASDWRSASTADTLMRLDQEQFAVEFLRRNPAYVQDYRNTQNRIAAGSLSRDAGKARFARRWGLSFPACA